jgi:antitoxin component of MazEF toxin-antitoxin module
MPPIKVKVRKVGDSLSITLPVEILERTGFKAGDYLEWELEGDTAVVRKKDAKDGVVLTMKKVEDKKDET